MMSPDATKQVNTVLGPVSTDSLGFTLSHEHIIISWAGLPQNYIELFNENLVDRLVEQLQEVKQEGVNTIVDSCTLDLGRDVPLLAEVSRRTGINIIATTGWWLEEPLLMEGVSADQLAKMFIREVRVGIAGTDIKPGILKGASDVPGVTPWQETILRGVARAHLATDTPIVLHSYAQGRLAERQLSVLKEEGVNLQRVMVAHCNDTTDVDYIKWILDQGCYVGMDRYPGHNELTMETRTNTLKTLIDMGYIDRILLSHDWFMEHIIVDDPKVNAFHRERSKYNPHGYLFLKKKVFPQLREMGVPEEQISRLCVSGPRNFFEGA